MQQLTPTYFLSASGPLAEDWVSFNVFKVMNPEGPGGLLDWGANGRLQLTLGQVEFELRGSTCT